MPGRNLFPRRERIACPAGTFTLLVAAQPGKTVFIDSIWVAQNGGGFGWIAALSNPAISVGPVFQCGGTGARSYGYVDARAIAATGDGIVYNNTFGGGGLDTVIYIVWHAE